MTEWNAPVQSVSVAIHLGYEPCDCGYEGPWEWKQPERVTPYVREERCPECGDIEVIDENGQVVEQRVVRGDVIDFVRERKRQRETP